MKKFLLLMTMFVASWGLMAQTNPSASELQENSIEFNWTGGNEQSSGTQWYKVDLSVVPAGENLMLFLDNLTSEAATVTVRVALVTGTTAQIQNDATTTKTIDPNRLYAKEIAHNLESWDKTWETIQKKKYLKMPNPSSFVRNNSQIDVFFGDGGFYVVYYYDRFGHHKIDCTEPQFYMDFCTEHGIPCEPIIRFLKYMKLMESEFSFDIP